jgi:hypothetical protein
MGKGSRFLMFLFGLAIASAAPAQQPHTKPTAQESARLKRLLPEASAAVRPLPASYGKRNLMLQLARAYWEAGDGAGARAEVQRLRKMYPAPSQADILDQPPPRRRPGMSPITELCIIADAVAQFGDTADALEIMREIGFRDDTHALETIAIRQAQAGDSQGALETTARINSEGRRSYILGEIVQDDLQRKDAPSALAVAAQIRPSPAKVQALVKIGREQVRGGDRPAAARSVEEARAIALQLPDSLPPGPQSFSMSYPCSPRPTKSPRDEALMFVAQGQWELGDHEEAMATREQIQSPPLQEQTLLEFVGIDAGENSFAEAGQLAGRISPGYCRNRAFAAIASAHVVAGDIRGAVSTLSQMQSSPPSDEWYRLAMKARNPSDARMLYSRARAAIPGSASGLSRAGALYGIAAFEELQGFRDIACSDFAEAIRLARESPPDTGRRPPGSVIGFNPGSVYSQVHYLAKCGQVPQAKALALAQAGDLREEDVASVAAIEAGDGDVQGAEHWAQSLETPADRAHALLAVADGILERVRMRARAAAQWQ